MGEGFDDDILEWKHNTETSKKKVQLWEVKNVQIPVINKDDMEVEVPVDFTKGTVSRYQHYLETIFQECQELLLRMWEELHSDLNQDVLERSLQHLECEELPTYRSEFFCIDYLYTFHYYYFLHYYFYSVYWYLLLYL